MTNQEIVRLLRQIATAYLLKDENRFKIIAYQRAADSIERCTASVKNLWQEGELNNLPGIGASIGSHIEELFKKGRVKHFDKVLKGLPPSLFPLLDVSGFGPKKAYKLVTQLKLENPKTVIDDLLKLAKEGKIAPIENFGEKSQKDIIESLLRFKKGQGKENRILLALAYEVASDIIDYLKKHKAVLEAVALGSLRRMAATIGDIDIAVATREREEVLDWFLKYPRKEKVVEKGPTGASIILDNGCQVDLRVQKRETFGSMLQYFTGSKEHNIRLREYALKNGLSLSEYGIKPLNEAQKSKVKSQNYNSKLKIYEYSSEEEFYKALGMAWIPPELREDRGEIEAALRQDESKQSGLPSLISQTDIKGDFHIHSNYNLEPSHDLGRSSLKEILLQAEKLDYEYVGINDHNPSYTDHSEDEIVKILKRRRYTFEQILASTKSVRVNLFIMLEVDIRPDGTLAIPEKAFDYLDGVVVSVHSSFKMPKDKMTKRILSGLSHPKAKILAHPSGRLIGQREGYEIDWSKLFEFCKNNNKAIEINSYPLRLDLSDMLVREAIRQKVKLAINTDSHEASQMKLMKFGVSVARRGWAEKGDILNTLPYNKVKEWLFK